MNIIQQQDRLKSLPEEVLIEYIANPTGEVPTFLALGEIERRKVMRNKYAAQQAEQPPVSEQIVQESMAAMMPQAMPQPPMAPAMPQPPMAPSGDAGITALPAPNVGQNYAQGGVVGYAAGDYIVLTPAQKEANKRAIRNLNNYYASPKRQPRVFDEVLGEYVVTDYEAPTEPTGITKPNIFGAAGPFGSTAYDNYVSGLKGLTNTEDNPSPISLLGRERFSGREITFDPNIPPASYDPETGNVIGLDRGIAGMSVGEEKFTTDQKADQKRFNEKRQKDQEEVAAGEKIIRDAKLKAAEEEEKKKGKKDGGEKVDTYYTDLRADIEGDRDLARDRDDALNMALITAGLGIAGGTSQNALENIAAGALPGVQSYTQSLKDIKDEERGIRKELRGVGALERAEQLEYAKIAAERGLSAKEYSDIMNDSSKLALEEFKELEGQRMSPLIDRIMTQMFPGREDYTEDNRESAVQEYLRRRREYHYVDKLEPYGYKLPEQLNPPTMGQYSIEGGFTQN